MNNHKQHIDLITTVANALGEINEQVVYVGGAIVKFNNPILNQLNKTSNHTPK